MLNELLKVKQHLVAETKLPAIDWDVVDSLVVDLHDVAVLTTKMQKEEYVMGDFFRDVNLCTQNMENLLPNDLVETMIFNLDERTQPLLSSHTFLASLVCDPRFNFEDSPGINVIQRRDSIVSIPYIKN